MACREWIPRLMSRMYDEIEGDESARVDAHLEACEACRSDYLSLLATRRLVSAHRGETPAPPRVVVLDAPARVRPSLAFAAGVLIAALVSVVSFRMGAAERTPSTPGAPRAATLADSVPAPEAIETAARSAADRRIEEWLRVRASQVPAEPPMTRAEFVAALDRFAKRLEDDRRDDLDFLMARIAASDLRTEGWMDETHKALQYVAYASTPGISPR